jgi:hypothetical protein
VSLDHLHGILCEGFILVLDVTFYGDESGVHDEHGNEEGSEVAAIGGYIATKRQWKKFEKRWNAVLHEFKVPEFHMSQYYRKEQDSDSPYLGWPNTKKKQFLRQLIKVARDNTTAAYASMVETQAWDTILDNWTKLGSPLDDSQKNPWHTCFQHFFVRFPRFLKEMVDPIISAHTPPEKVAFVFHQHEVFGPAAEIGYAIVQKMPEHGARLGTIAFGATADYPPLQAADLLAFYARRRFTRCLKGVDPDEFELALLGNEKRVWLFELSPENLEDLRQKNEQVRYARDVASGKTTTGTR